MKILKFGIKVNTYAIIFSSIFMAQQVFSAGVVIVHPDNPATFDSKAVQRIFLGKVGSFPNGSKAVPLDLISTYPLHKEFCEAVLNKKQRQLESYWARLMFTGKGIPPKSMDSESDIIELVKNNPNIIGYISADAVTDEVKVVLEF